MVVLCTCLQKTGMIYTLLVLMHSTMSLTLGDDCGYSSELTLCQSSMRSLVTRVSATLQLPHSQTGVSCSQTPQILCPHVTFVQLQVCRRAIKFLSLQHSSGQLAVDKASTSPQTSGSKHAYFTSNKSNRIRRSSRIYMQKSSYERKPKSVFLLFFFFISSLLRILPQANQIKFISINSILKPVYKGILAAYQCI